MRSFQLNFFKSVTHKTVYIYLLIHVHVDGYLMYEILKSAVVIKNDGALLLQEWAKSFCNCKMICCIYWYTNVTYLGVICNWQWLVHISSFFSPFNFLYTGAPSGGDSQEAGEQAPQGVLGAPGTRQSGSGWWRWGGRYLSPFIW